MDTEMIKSRDDWKNTIQKNCTERIFFAEVDTTDDTEDTPKNYHLSIEAAINPILVHKLLFILFIKLPKSLRTTMGRLWLIMSL